MSSQHSWVRAAERRGRSEANFSSAEEFILIGPCLSSCQGSHVLIRRSHVSLESHCQALCPCVPFAVYKELLQKTNRTAGCVHCVSVITKHSKWWNPTQQLLAGLWYKELYWRKEFLFFSHVGFLFPRKDLNRHNPQHSFKHTLKTDQKEKPHETLKYTAIRDRAEFGWATWSSGNFRSQKSLGLASHVLFVTAIQLCPQSVNTHTAYR